MTDERRTLHLLRDRLDTLPTHAPAHLLAAVVNEVAHESTRSADGEVESFAATQACRRALGLVGRLRRRGGACAGRFASAHADPRRWARSECDNVRNAGAVDDAGSGRRLDSDGGSDPEACTGSDRAGVAADGVDAPYSSTVNPWVTFELACTLACRPTIAEEFCPIENTAGRLSFPHAKSCADGISLLRPESVACGAAPSQPTADELAAALLAMTDVLASRDLDAASTGIALPTDFFAVAYHRRVIGVADVASESPAPEGCGFLLGKGLSESIPPVGDDLNAFSVDAQFALRDRGDDQFRERPAFAGHAPQRPVHALSTVPTGGEPVD